MNKKRNNIIVLNEIDSTNNYANTLISQNRAVDGTVVLAYYQQKGRGQRGNGWESERGKNLLFSNVLFPQFLPVSKQFYLSKIVSLAILDWLKTQVKNVSIKWPNDIYVGDKKLAGILIETSLKGSSFFSAVIGVGLNLNQEKFSEVLPNPVSLKQLTNKEYDIIETVGQLKQNIAEWYKVLKEGNLIRIDTEYHNNLFRKNKWAMYLQKGRLFEARIVGTGEYGRLILEDRSGNLTSYFFKEVEFVIK